MSETAKQIIDDLHQEQLLKENGTLCYRCGCMNEDLVEEGSRLLKESPGKPYICSVCKMVMDTGYTPDVIENNEVVFTSLLEDGFMPVEDKEEC